MKTSLLVKLLYCPLILFLICTCSKQQLVDTIEIRQVTIDTIPFKLTSYNNLLIQGIFNEEDTLALMFHLATEGVSLTTAGLKKVNSIQLDQLAQVNSWGGSRESRFSSQNKLQVGEFQWDSIGITESLRSGHFSDGKIGYNYWKDRVMEVNFDESQILLYDSIMALPAGYLEMDIHFEGSSIFINGELSVGDSVLSHTFLVHSGFSGLIMLDDAFVAAHGINNKLETIKESTLQDSNGNTLTTKTVLAPKFSLGNYVLTELPVGTFAGKLKRQSISVLGGDALKRFNIFFDFPRKKVYFKKNQYFSAAYFEQAG